MQSTSVVSTTRSFKERLARLYRVYAPEKLAKIDEALFAFSGREIEMMRIATSKYGPEPSDNFYNLFVSSEEGGPIVDAAIDDAGGIELGAQRPPSASMRSYSQRLMWLFLTYCPDKILMMDDVLYAYRANQEQMISDFVSEYGPEPEVDHRKFRLKRFYEYYCPEKVSSVDQILLAYAAEPEEKLYEDLKRKYGPEPSKYCAGTLASDKRLADTILSKERGGDSKINRSSPGSPTALGPGAAPTAAVDNDATTTLSRDATLAFTKSRLLEFYNFYCPQKIPLVDDILATYTMHPRGIRQLFLLLEEKYGPEPCKVRTSNANDGTGDSCDSHSGTSAERQSDRYSMFSEATASLLAPRAFAGLSPDESTAPSAAAIASKSEDLPRLADRLYRMMLFYDPSRLPDLYATMPFLTAEDAAHQLHLWVQYFGSEPSEDALMDLQRLVVSKESADVAMRRLHGTPFHQQQVDAASMSTTSNVGMERGTSTTYPPTTLSTASSMRLQQASPSASFVATSSAARWQQQRDEDGETLAQTRDGGESGASSPSHSSLRENNTPPPVAATSPSGPSTVAVERHRSEPVLRPCTFPQRPLTPSVYPYALYLCCAERGMTASFQVWYDAACDCTISSDSPIILQSADASSEEHERGTTRWLVNLLLTTTGLSGASNRQDDSTSAPTFSWRKESSLASISLLPHAPLQQPWVPAPLRTQCFADVVAFVLPFYFHRIDAVMALLQRATIGVGLDANGGRDGPPPDSWEDGVLIALREGTDNRVSVLLGHCVKEVLQLPGHQGVADDDPSFLNHVMSVQLAGHALRYLICVTLLEAQERRQRYPFQEWNVSLGHAGEQACVGSGNDSSKTVKTSTVVGQGNTILELQDREFRAIRALFVDSILDVIRKEHCQRMVHTEVVLREGLEMEEEYQRSIILLEWGRVLFLAGMVDGSPWRLNDASNDGVDDNGGGDSRRQGSSSSAWRKQHGMVCIVEQQWSVFTKPIYKPETARGASHAKALLQSTAPKQRGKRQTPSRPSPSPSRSARATCPSLTALSPKPDKRPFRTVDIASTKSAATSISLPANTALGVDAPPDASTVMSSLRDDPRVVRYRAAKSQGGRCGVRRESPQLSARRARQRAADEAISENPYQRIQFPRTLRQGYDSVSPHRPHTHPAPSPARGSTTPRANAKMASHTNSIVVAPRCSVPKGKFSLYSDFSVRHDNPSEQQHLHQSSPVASSS